MHRGNVDLLLGNCGVWDFNPRCPQARRKPEGMLPFARMVGIILATLYFPILTIPGIICVLRVTKHFAGYCESVAGNQSKGAS